MQLPIGIDKGDGQPLQLQVFEQVRELIADGRLTPGTLVPASRVLANDLGVSRNTVVLAYERLVSEGYLETRQPTGTFVSSHIIFDSPLEPETSAVEAPSRAPVDHVGRLQFQGESHVVVSPYDEPVAYDFWVGRPDARLFPARDWQRLINSCLRRQVRAGISSYGEPAGLRPLREAVAEYTGAARGIRATPEQVLIINGIQEGLNILARLFVREGVPVALEDPGYRGAANVFTSYGARLVPIPVDRDGADVDRIPRDPVLAYLTPSHQYPTGVTLPQPRRTRLLEWAQRAQAYIVEDDYDSDFYYDGAPLPALQSRDTNDQVIYLGTFSKSLAPGLRIGYMIVPQHLTAAAVTVKALLNNCSSWLPQVLLADFLTSGAFMHHLRRLRTAYCARRDCLVDALQRQFGEVEIRGTQGGMHLVWQLPEDFPTAFELERRCRGEGVGIYSGETGNAIKINGAAPYYARMVMLGYAALDEDEIAEGIRRLATVL